MAHEQAGLLDKLFLDVGETVRVTGLSRTVVYEKMATGEIPFVRIGAKRLVPTSRLREWADRLVDAQAAAAV